jgi:hypothetical protein
VDLLFLRGLVHILAHAFNEVRFRVIAAIGRPRAKQCLVIKVFVASIGRHVPANGSSCRRIDPCPTCDHFAPGLRYFGENVQAGSRILTTFRVVRGSGEDRKGKALEPFAIRLVKFLDRYAEIARIAAYFVQGHQGPIAIERSVFKPFGLDPAGILLKLHREAHAPLILLL